MSQWTTAACGSGATRPKAVLAHIGTDTWKQPFAGCDKLTTARPGLDSANAESGSAEMIQTPIEKWPHLASREPSAMGIERCN
jgi:hypothetical protein